MNRPSNSQIERHYFEQFRGDYLLPPGKIEYTDKPDVVIRGAATLGIEITNLYIRPGTDPTSEQVQRRRREQVLQRAQALYLAAGGRRLELSLDFHPDRPILSAEPLAQDLSLLAFTLGSAASGRVNPNLFAHIEPLRFVYLNAIEYVDASWRLAQSFTVPELSAERLREVVAEKSMRLSAYQRCDRYWLLVVVDLMDAAQDQHITWPVEQALCDIPYEKVLIYKPQLKQVFEVPQ